MLAPFFHRLRDCLHPYEAVAALVGMVVVLAVVKSICRCCIHPQSRNRRIRGYEYSENIYPAITSNDVIINNLPDRSGLYYYSKEDKTLVYEGDLKVAPVVIIPEEIREEEGTDPYRKVIPNAVCVNEQIVPISPLHQSSCFYSPVYITNTHNRGSSINDEYSTSRNLFPSHIRDHHKYSRV